MVTEAEPGDQEDENLVRRGWWMDGVLGIAKAICLLPSDDSGRPCQGCVAQINQVLGVVFDVSL